MKPRPDKLDRDAILMLYASGEMPLEQKAKVDAMLAGDEAMRAELSQLLDAQVMFDRGIAEADRCEGLPIPETAAQRAVSRVIRQRQADQLSKPMKVASEPSRRWMMLMYPAAVAAAVMAFGIYKWSRVIDNGPRPATPAYAGPVAPDDTDSTDAPDDSQGLFANMTRPTDDLDQVESQIQTLAEWSKSLQ